MCLEGNYCTDVVERTTKWQGKIGLLLISDYGYATGGGNTTDRTTCLNTFLYSWNKDNVSDCKNNNWQLNSSSWQWSLIASPFSSDNATVYDISYAGHIGWFHVSNNIAVYPSVYLKSSVKIASGDGTKDNAFVLTE